MLLLLLLLQGGVVEEVIIQEISAGVVGVRAWWEGASVVRVGG